MQAIPVRHGRNSTDVGTSSLILTWHVRDIMNSGDHEKLERNEDSMLFSSSCPSKGMELNKACAVIHDMYMKC